MSVDRPGIPARPRPPSVEAVLVEARARLAEAGELETTEAGALLAAARDVVAAARHEFLRGGPGVTPAQLGGRAVAKLADHAGGIDGSAPTPVLNATGVLIHTNLGRAPWPAVAAGTATALATQYLLLELDVETGKRGARARVAEDHLVALTGAEDAFVTNNNAAALVLAVGLVGRGGIVVSRGELVEIGGGVRIPDIVRRAGATLIEVGTTNRTRAADFAGPLADGSARAVLRVHPSNFSMAGFTEAPDPREVAVLAHDHGAIVIDDLGSGALLDTAAYGLPHEPTPGERLATGSDLVTFSGDKLVGGPQAGLVVGKAPLVERLRRDPLARAMRPDKVTMAAMAHTLALYRAGHQADIPIWAMLARPLDELEAAARRHAGRDGWQAVPTRATIGGGALPGETVPSWGVAIEHGRPDALLRALRLDRPAVIGRIDDDRVILDLRTVDPERWDALFEVAARAWAAV